MPQSKRITPEDGKVKVELQWKLDDDVPTVYANQLLMSNAGSEFYLIFGEVIPIGVKDPFNIPSKLYVHPRIRVAISREIMGQFVKVIDGNFEQFIERMAGEVNQNDGNSNQQE